MSKKNYLILVNSADKMGKYHFGLGDQLTKEGNNVTYAFLDKLPIYTEKLDTKNRNLVFFSEYFKEHFDLPELSNIKYEDVNLNKLYFSDFDRINKYNGVKIFKDEYYHSLVINLINFFDKIQNDNNIDIYIYESISNSFAYAAFEVSKRNNAFYCGYGGCRLKDRFELFTEEFGSIEYFRNIFENLKIADISKEDLSFADQYLLQYTTEGSTPSYHPKKTHLDWNYSLFKRYLNSDKINIVIGAVKYLVKESKTRKFGYQAPNPVLEIANGFKMQMQKQFRLKFTSKYFDKVDADEKFYLYPQHFKPEASTSVMAKDYCDDIAVITNIAFNLPFGAKLYVKEHFVNYGRLPLAYYKALKNIPNVKLISQEENIKTLIANSQAVITLTSTVGFEALMMNKPVFIFGNAFYESHPNCRKLTSFESLFNKLVDLDILEDRDINRKFIVAYKKSSYPGIVYYSLFKDYPMQDFTEPFINAMNERFN